MRLLRLDVELPAESAPLLLLFADHLRGAFRRAAAVRGQAQRQEPLFDFGAAQVAIDRAIELRDHFGWCAGRRNNGKKAVHDDAGNGFVQRRQIRKAGKALARSHRKPAHLAGLDDGVRGRDRAHHYRIDAAGDVLGHLRRRTIRHLDQAEVGPFVEQPGGERRGAGGVVERDRQLCAICPGMGDQLAHRGDRQIGIHRKHLRTEAGGQRHRGEIARRIVRQVLERDEVDRHAGRVGEQQRVAVGRGARGDLMGKDAGSAGHVFDEHRPADGARHGLGDQPRHDVGCGARTGRNDQLDGTARPGLRARRARHCDRNGA